MMLRFLYVWLLRLHPRYFRERFGQEMLWIFDQAPAVGMLADATRSLLRQWTLRSDFWAAPAVDGVPMFYTSADWHPRPVPLISGIIVTALLFVGILFAAAHAGGGRSLPVLDLSSGDVAGAAAMKKMWPRLSGLFDRFGPVSVPEPVLRGSSPVAAALDANHDGTISAEEIENAPPVLNALARTLKSATTKTGRPLLDPVLDALDTNRDGQVSAAEIRNSPVALRALDRNHDGNLTPDEILVDPLTNAVALILAQLDKNSDGRITPEERTNPFAERVRSLLDSADRDKDGVITEEELKIEMRARWH
jgi:Ca2+-binding EF-hand superfamily protein